MLLAAPAAALAQAGPPVPLATDLTKVPVGAWSEYTVSMAQMPAMKQRYALVGRQGKNNTLEMQAKSGATDVAVHVGIDPSAAPGQRIKKLVMQLGNLSPMEMPLQGGAIPKEQFGELDPKKFVQAETVTVPAGTFKAKLYRDKMADGSGVEYWVTEEVPPLGIVQMNSDIKTGLVTGKITVQLSGRGKGAKPAVTKTARPYNQATLMQEMMQLQGGAAGGPSHK